MLRARSFLVAAAAAVSMVGGAAPPASAVMSYAPCTPAGFDCGSLTVPLDRTGAVAGSIGLQVKRVVATANPTRTAVVALAGGPGQAAIPAATDFAKILAPALASRDLLVYDQRGTGQSSRLRCAAIEQGVGSIADVVSNCAGELGPARGLFRTTDSVDDIEAIRAESGYEKLVLFGVSYGTKVAQDYAARYPARVESLVLDSLVPPGGADVFSRTSLRAVGPALRELCGSGACRGITADPRAQVAQLVTRTTRRALRGSINGPFGRRLRVTLDPSTLFDLILAGDTNPMLRADLPGAMRSALRGDTSPIMRLRARAEGLTGGPRSPLPVPLDSTDSIALLLATRCEESWFPWDRSATPATRARQASAAARALPRSELGAFTPRVALRSELIPVCAGWPNASPPPAPPSPPAPVPTLIIEGGADVRTPLEGARAVAATIPGAQLVTVPFTGHSVLGSDRTGCASAAVAAFFAGAPLPACPGARVAAPARVAPTRLSTVAGRSPVSRTLNAVRATVADVRRQFLGDAIEEGRPPRPGARIGGLRSGMATWTRTGVRYRGVEYVPGVVVTGFSPHERRRAAHFTVTGTAAAPGTLRFLADGRVTGTLAGRPVRGRPSRAASARAGEDPGTVRMPPYPRVVALG